MQDFRPAHALRIRYLIGLAAIALLVTSSYLTMQRIVSEQRDFAKLINVAGHQGGLANRIAFFASMMVHAADETEYEVAKSQVGRTIRRMQESHRLLLEGAPDRGVPHVTNDRLWEIYFGPAGGLDGAVERFLDHARSVYDSSMENLRSGSLAYIYLTTYGPHALEPLFDSAVEEYEAIARAAILRIETLELWIWIAALITLVLEVGMIFRPLERRISDTMSSLRQAVTDLRHTQGRLLTAQQIAQVGDWWWNLEDDRLTWSDQVYRVFGVEPASFAPSPGALAQRLIAEDRERLSRGLDEVRAGAECSRLKYRIVRADGAERMIQQEIRAEKDQDDVVVALTGTIQDITEQTELATRLEKLSANIPGFIFQFCRHVDGSSRYPYASPGIQDVFGIDAALVVDDAGPVFAAIHAGDRARLLAVFESADGLATPWRDEFRVIHPIKGETWVEGHATPERLSNGDVLWHGHIWDISTRKRNEERLHQAAAVFANTAEGVSITQLDGTIVDVNDAFVDITGYTRDEVIGENPRLLKSDRHDVSFYRAMWQSLCETGQWRGEIWNRRKDGTIYPELLTISAVRDANGQASGYVGVFADITALKQSEERLDHLAHHDPLTGLPNRLLVNERLGQSVKHSARQGTELAVVFIDLDHFKHVNDSLGHAAGDDLLVQLAQRLRNAVRSDDTVSRISGDEFVVILEDIGGTENAAKVVDKLIAAFKSPFLLDNNEVRISASMGISLYPQDGDEAAMLLRNADAAMYGAKDEGRNTYQFYTRELTAAAFEHVFLENALRGALDRDEFRLVYQPQIDLASGSIIGLEALIRWHHPKRGIVPPQRFVPFAEQNGLIRDIGAWVLRTACKQFRHWLDMGLDPGRIAVNVSGAQIQGGNFVGLVDEVLEETGLPAARLALELTESFVMRRATTSIEQFSLLRGMGVTIAIDDFGTGYSSLSYLKQLPVDKLKIDRSFVKEIPHDTNDRAIAEAVIAMGRALNIDIIAEGVETEQQARFLSDRGCVEAQGYLFSRPMAAEKLEIMLLDSTRDDRLLG